MFKYSYMNISIRQIDQRKQNKLNIILDVQFNWNEIRVQTQ